MRKRDFERIGNNWSEDKSMFWPVLRVVGLFMVFLFAVGVFGNVLGWFGEAQQVVSEEFGPRAMLQKYEWFKDAKAQLEQKIATVDTLQVRITGLEGDYAGVSRRLWPRDDRQLHGQMTAEVAGVKASFNILAAEYNAEMAKINWAFANVGQLPRGAADPLPREFAPYVTE